MLKAVVAVVGVLVAFIGGALAAMIVFGTSGPPPALASISEPFQTADFRDLPTLETVPARDGASIAFRHWQNTPKDESKLIVIAIHGSSASSATLHPLAKALGASGFPVYAPDIRGHGQTGRRGDIDYSGQLDDDLADFITAIKTRHPQSRLALLGFSSGGGFALHVAGSPFGRTFERIVLLSPMLGVRAPTVRLEGDAWAKPFIPRIIALLVLNQLGIHAFDHLPVLAFAIPSDHADMLTASYSFRLMHAFGTTDHKADLKNAAPPVAVLVGEKDELFDADLFAPTIHAVLPDVPVTIIPGLTHIEMTTAPRAVPAIVNALRGAV